MFHYLGTFLKDFRGDMKSWKGLETQLPHDSPEVASSLNIRHGGMCCQAYFED